MKNTYFTSYFPLLAIMLFCLSLSIRIEMTLLDFLKETGIYEGMREFLSDSGIRLSLLAGLFLLLFMVFAALKLIADTVNELSLLFFSKDLEGESLKEIRSGSLIYLIGGALSILSIFSYAGIIGIFLLCSLIYFIFFVYKISPSLSVAGTIGIVFFHVIFWAAFFTGVFYLGVKLYNSLIAGLPI